MGSQLWLHLAMTWTRKILAFDIQMLARCHTRNTNLSIQRKSSSRRTTHTKLTFRNSTHPSLPLAPQMFTFILERLQLQRVHRVSTPFCIFWFCSRLIRSNQQLAELSEQSFNAKKPHSTTTLYDAAHRNVNMGT